ncbi:MAG: glycosyltransferase family 4 protein [Spirochaetales bacterium]|jgi:glycosyltransferase involved in cell wall biosynthesis|nr:glycosyltransferase family 4 protein [Spirochaetales bacterium]
MRRRFGNEGAIALAVLIDRVTVARAAASHAARHGVTHVHCHDPLLARAYAFFAPLYGATGCWGYSAHGYGRYVQLRLGVETSKNSLASLQRMENQAASRASWVIAPSRSGLEQMRRDLSYSAMPSRWHMVPHVVIKPLACDRIAARKAMGMGGNEKLLVAVGQLIPLKRFSLLLESIALLPAELHPRLLILGEGEERVALQALAEKLGLASRFEIRMTDNIGKYLAAADIYASVSSTEAYGIANCEALLAEIPSVCTAVGAVPEVLGEGALLVGDKPEQIASALARLLTSSEEQKMLMAKSKLRVAQWLEPKEVASALENIYVGSKCCLV